MKKALIYCRVSTHKQKNEGGGLDSQEHRCRKYIQGKGYIEEKVFRDDYTGGGDFTKRPAMQAMLDYMDQHVETDYIIVFDDLKRFARDTAFHFKLKKELKSRNAIPECLNFNFEDSPEGEFIETIMAAQGELERKQNLRQVNQKMRARLERGYAVFCPPTGLEYRKTIEHGKLLHRKDPIAKVLVEALEGFANNKFINQTDVQNFYESKKDILNKSKVHLEFVKRTLTEILYTGYIEYPNWKISLRKGHHKGIISIETFNKIQEKLKKPEKLIRVTDKAEFPLRRFIDCAFCDKTMTASNVKGKLQYYPMYTCQNSKCKAKPKNIQKKILEIAYIQLLTNIAPRNEILQLMEAIALDKWKESVSAINIHEKKSEKEIMQKNIEIKDYVKLMRKTKSNIVRVEYEEMIENLSKEKEILKTQNKKPVNQNFEEILEEVLDFVRTPASYWEKTDLEGKFMVHRLIFNKNPHYDSQNGFRTPQITLPFAIKGLLETSNNHLVEMPGIEPGSKNV